jgi:hypothetical protein
MIDWLHLNPFLKKGKVPTRTQTTFKVNKCRQKTTKVEVEPKRKDEKKSRKKQNKPQNRIDWRGKE